MPVHLAAAPGSVYAAGYLNLAEPKGGIVAVDADSGKVVASKEHLCGDCPLAVGEGALWYALRDTAIRLDANTLDWQASVPLPDTATAIAAVGDKIQVGLDNARIVIVDPVANAVATTVPLEHGPSVPRKGGVAAIMPVRLDVPAHNSAALRSDGDVFVVVDNHSAPSVTRFEFNARTMQAAEDANAPWWGAGGSLVGVISNTGEGDATFVYDPRRDRFVRANTSDDSLLLRAGDDGFETIAVHGDTLWLGRYRNETAEVLRVQVR